MLMTASIENESSITTVVTNHNVESGWNFYCYRSPKDINVNDLEKNALIFGNRMTHMGAKFAAWNFRRRRAAMKRWGWD